MVDSIPNGVVRLPIKVDPTAEVSVDFQRNASSVKKIVVSVNELLVPSITTDVSALDLNTSSSNAILDFGIPIPHNISNEQQFGYSALPTGCYSESGSYTEFENSSVLANSFNAAYNPLDTVLDEITLNQTIDASFLTSQEKENLVSGIYEYCETNLFSSVTLTNKNTNATKDLFSYEEEGNATGSLKLRMVSDPVMINVNRSAFR